MVHETPSRKGLRVVCLCRPECKSIAENQAWFKAQTGLDIDATTKDEARFSYLVPSEYFYYFDNEIWDLESPKTPLNAYDTENNLNHESHESTRISQSSGQGSGNSEYSVNKTTENTEYTENMSGNSEYSVVEKEKIREDSCNSWLNKEPYLYRGKSIKEIAEAYVSHFGGPVQGERHTYYYKMCAYFNYLRL